MAQSLFEVQINNILNLKNKIVNILNKPKKSCMRIVVGDQTAGTCHSDTPSG